MAFIIDFPLSFKIGDTADCHINGQPKRVTWRDEGTMVILPDDARTIQRSFSSGGLRTFICTNAGVPAVKVFGA
jgi:hypothetical protein